MEPQKMSNNQSNLEKEEQTRVITYFDLKLYYKSIVIKTMLCHEIDIQINGTEKKPQK